ncbi:MAG TPA: FAD:protein FMN transferase [Solirubrobacteraceae bacterium]|nr:FAD:protein FMN transferase [Solirubrobacteraceae bacterium]
MSSEALSRFSVWGGVAVVATTEANALEPAQQAVIETVEGFDAACSPFREDSELSAVNRAGGRAVQVGPVLFDAVRAALRGAILTDGRVDPTVGSALVALGYYDDVERPAVSFAAVPGWRGVFLDERVRTVRLVPGVALDLGASAKALAADRAAAAACAAAGCGVLVSLGGDIAVAGEPPTDGWRVHVTDDHRAAPDAPGQTVVISDGGLATSSCTVRRWRAGGQNVHHVIDPATGAPVDAVWRTVSVTAASCLDANIASTAAIVSGSAAVEWLASHGLAARLVGTDGDAVHVGGWPAQGEDLPVREEALR